jgi:predicted nucleic-acid-binding protein
VKATGLDTSVIIRLLTGEPEKQALSAKEFVLACADQGITLRVSDLAVGESYYALTYHYGAEKRAAVAALLDLLTSPMISPTGQSVKVLRDYKATGAGLMDRLIRADYLREADTVVTFDRHFSKLSQVTLL